MGYNAAFFEAYRKYLVEPTVRKNHNRVFREWFDRTAPYLISVVDLGCGTGEFYQHGHCTEYVGVDIEPRIEDHRAQTVAASYVLDHAWTSQLPFEPNAFVSLFSIEPVLDAASRYVVYDRLFRELPTLRFGLSAGFYYANRADKLHVIEAEGIISNQTIDQLGVFPTDGYDEERLVMRTPSAMFGPDVVEVWKFFTRKG
jgi:SAM-dependent methyltransferase